MEKFGENFRGGQDCVICTLCGSHFDSQEMSFQCQVLKKNIEIDGCMNDLYEDNINIKVVETIERITKYREENL